MRQRIAFGGVGMAAVLTLVLLGLTVVPRPASAFEKMAEELKRASSLTVELIQEGEFVAGPGTSPVKTELKSTMDWLAPNSYRMEIHGDRSAGDIHTVFVFPADKPGVSIDHRTKTYERHSARKGHVSPFLTLLDRLSKFSGKADRELGRKQIDGRAATGFVIDAANIDPDGYGGPLEIWLDDETRLPAEIRQEFSAEGNKVVLRWKDFVWNEQLDPKRFEVTAPDNYMETTPAPPELEHQITEIRQALQLYAKLSGGHYPRVKMVYGDVTRDKMLELAGFRGPITAEQFRDKKFQEIQQAVNGLARMNVILRDNADAAYQGIHVSPKDAGRVLMRWQLDDGRYQVIFGDLSAEIVSAQRLRKLEQ